MLHNPASGPGNSPAPADDPSRPDLLDADEAANSLRLSRQYLAKLRVTGGGPLFVKLGRRVLYRRADLDAWLDAQVRRSTSDRGEGTNG